MGSLGVGHDWVTSFDFSLSCIGGGNGKPLQCSCLENPMDREAWWAAVYGVTQSRTRLKRLSSSSSSSKILWMWLFSFQNILKMTLYIHIIQFSSVQSLSHVWLCDPMNHSTPGLPVHHQLLEFTQTHVHRVGDGLDEIQPSHPLSSPSPPAPNPSQHQSLLQWVKSLHEVAKVLEFQL